MTHATDNMNPGYQTHHIQGDGAGIQGSALSHGNSMQQAAFHHPEGAQLRPVEIQLQEGHQLSVTKSFETGTMDQPIDMTNMRKMLGQIGLMQCDISHVTSKSDGSSLANRHELTVSWSDPHIHPQAVHAAMNEALYANGLQNVTSQWDTSFSASSQTAAHVQASDNMQNQAGYAQAIEQQRTAGHPVQAEQHPAASWQDHMDQTQGMAPALSR